MRLEKVQSRAARLVTGTSLRTSTDKLRQDLGWDTLKTRRTMHKQMFFFHRLTNTLQQQPEYIRQILPQSRVHNIGRSLRNYGTLTLPANRTTSFQRSFIPNTTRTWNTLPETLRTQPSHNRFKKGIADLFGTTKPPTYFSFGSKLGNTYHTQIRTGSLQLNAYLYQTQRLSSPGCLCGHKSETLQHFIFHCPLFQDFRTKLLRQLSQLLGPDFTRLSNADILHTLTHGHNIHSDDGRVLAGLFQGYVKESMRRRRAGAAMAAVAAGAATD